ncbi:translation initiation factor 1 (eIF-1/SUI1) [Singulisphaera sp. GP187]|uniref:translation initiation factor n=1 Tax=Singulisphaera sp. GP187 TaxID=1882752 RepID=UPI000929B5A1|nr:translation initiation factor [Singulisphaera sp. GP187]SIN76745.1 translation initiation factor 1 (eIF-1/SUI1) [Singulisphaera sp. GP187]
MQRLFAGTPFDRPPTCERCGRLEAECTCPPPILEPVRIAPDKQTARVRLEKRVKGKVVTVVANLSAEGNDLPELAAKLKEKCGSGGTVKDGLVEIQGDHVTTVENALKVLGYRTKRG